MKKVILVVSLIGMFLLGSCGISIVSAEQNNPLKIWFENDNGWVHTYKVIDENTGVNYIVVNTERGNGGDMSIAITPRLKADGSLYISQ